MRSDGGPEVAVIEASGWDTHANQGGAKGALAQRLAGLDKALRSLADELGPLWPQTAVLVVTEFGRTAAVNGTRGTDHGTGGCAFLMGGAVRGGRVIADWPGLGPTALLDNRDLEADAGFAQRIQSRARRAHARRCEYSGQASIPGQQRRAPSSRADTRLTATQSISYIPDGFTSPTVSDPAMQRSMSVRLAPRPALTAAAPAAPAPWGRRVLAWAELLRPPASGAGLRRGFRRRFRHRLLGSCLLGRSLRL